jgi:hypothetical protein
MMKSGLIIIPVLVAVIMCFSANGRASRDAAAPAQKDDKKDALIKNAERPTDHRKLAVYYRQEMLRISD